MVATPVRVKPYGGFDSLPEPYGGHGNVWPEPMVLSQRQSAMMHLQCYDALTKRSVAYDDQPSLDFAL